METVLCDLKGQAVAYIVTEDDNTIYLWSGHAVAYLNERRIYGWKGKHLGWFIDGIVYDCLGHQVGFTKEKSPIAIDTTVAKSPRLAQTLKFPPYPPVPKPILTTIKADLTLLRFLKQERK